MWKYLYALASPKQFYAIANRFTRLLYPFSLLAFLMGSGWALFIAPSDYQQGDAFRIIYIHVPAAFLSLFIYAFICFQAVLLLVWRIKLSGLVLKNAAVLGAWMTLITLVTGAIWGKPMWGTWWIWDARLTSELVLLFIYLGLIALFNAMPTYDKGIRAMAFMALVGFIDLPIIHYSVYWWNTLHQGQTLSVFAKPTIALPMLYPLLVMISAFISYFFALLFERVRDELLWLERRAQWVRQMVDEWEQV